MIRLRVKEVAKKKNMSQRQLSIRSGVDIRTVQRIFRDPTRIVTTETLDKFARVLNVDASLLIESDPPLPKSLERVIDPAEEE